MIRKAIENPLTKVGTYDIIHKNLRIEGALNTDRITILIKKAAMEAEKAQIPILQAPWSLGHTVSIPEMSVQRTEGFCPYCRPGNSA